MQLTSRSLHEHHGGKGYIPRKSRRYKVPSRRTGYSVYIVVQVPTLHVLTSWRLDGIALSLSLRRLPRLILDHGAVGPLFFLPCGPPCGVWNRSSTHQQILISHPLSIGKQLSPRTRWITPKTLPRSHGGSRGPGTATQTAIPSDEWVSLLVAKVSSSGVLAHWTLHPLHLGCWHVARAHRISSTLISVG